MTIIKKYIALLACTLVFTLGHTQEPEETLSGLVTSSDNDIFGIHVLNLASNRGTITDLAGRFSIKVQISDTLLFSSVQLKNKYLVISKEVLSRDQVLINLEELVNQLDEVIVRPYNLTGILEKDIAELLIPEEVNASSLGLPNANVKIPSQNERRLFEADNGKFIDFYGHYFGLGISINLHKILNRASGRTKELKKLVIKNEDTKKIEGVWFLFNDSIQLKELKIPISRAEEFFIYCQADSSFITMVEAKDYLAISQFMKRKSEIFREENQL